MLEDQAALLAVFILIAVGGLASFVGTVFSIVLIVFWAKQGNSGPNKYGPDPRRPTSQ